MKYGQNLPGDSQPLRNSIVDSVPHTREDLDNKWWHVSILLARFQYLILAQAAPKFYKKFEHPTTFYEIVYP